MRSRLLPAVALAFSVTTAWGQANAPVWLVTPDEARTFGGASGFDSPLPPRTRGLVLPAIEVVQPQALSDQKIKAPFPITLKFMAGDAAIVPGSFKVLYGSFRVDITQRVAKFVQPSAEGFSVDKAQVPAGRHRIFLQVNDEKQRVAERELRIEVE